MMRAAVLLLLLATAPAFAQPPARAAPEAPASAAKPDARQPLVNILRGSAATPGGAALLSLAEASLARAKAAAGRGDMPAAERELRVIAGDQESGAFARAIAAIAANAALAGYSKAITPADAARIGDCADGIADAAEAPSPSLDRLENGIDANGDGKASWSLEECGLAQLRQITVQAAGASGL